MTCIFIFIMDQMCRDHLIRGLKSVMFFFFGMTVLNEIK